MNVMRAAILVVALIVVACAPAPLEFADWHGHLWVYPTVGDPAADVSEEPASPETRPGDVYSSDGRLLYSGAADSARWHL